MTVQELEQRFIDAYGDKPIRTCALLDSYPKLLLVTSFYEAAALDLCGLPFIGVGEKLITQEEKLQDTLYSQTIIVQVAEGILKYCNQHGIELYFAGSKSLVDQQVKKILDQTGFYRSLHLPEAYFNWHEFLATEGEDAVIRYVSTKLEPAHEAAKPDLSQLVMDFFGGGELVAVQAL